MGFLVLLLLSLLGVAVQVRVREVGLEGKVVVYLVSLKWWNVKEERKEVEEILL